MRFGRRLPLALLERRMKDLAPIADRQVREVGLLEQLAVFVRELSCA